MASYPTRKMMPLRSFTRQLSRLADRDSGPRNRRGAYRHTPRPGIAFDCHSLACKEQDAVFVSLLDISADGVRMLLAGRVDEGEYLGLRVAIPGRRRAKWLWIHVVWSMATADGNHCVGARFLRPLSDSELARLAQAFKKQSCTIEAATSSSPTENITNRNSRARCVRTSASMSSSSERARSRLPRPSRSAVAMAVCISGIDVSRILADYSHSTDGEKVVTSEFACLTPQARSTSSIHPAT